MRNDDFFYFERRHGMHVSTRDGQLIAAFFQHLKNSLYQI